MRHVIVTNTASGSVSILAAHSGAVLWTVPVALDPTAAVVDGASGHVFVLGGVDGGVRIVSGRPGAPPRTIPLDASLGAVTTGPWLGAVAVDERHGRVLVLDGDGASVGLLDARRGHALRTIGVGLHPLAVAIDARADRA